MQRTKASLWVLAATAVTVGTLFMLPFTPKVGVETTFVRNGELQKTALLEGVIMFQNQQPCVNYQAGQISAVHVMQGESVSVGELLFSLDTSVEEETLAVISGLLHEQEQLLWDKAYADVLSVATMQSTWDVKMTEAQLQASIESKQIRAERDGIMGGVYVKEGDYVDALTALGIVRGTDKCISAVNLMSNTSEVAQGAQARMLSAKGTLLGIATLEGMSAPQVDENTSKVIQQLVFHPQTSSELSGSEIGDQVTIEMLYEAYPDMALVPVSAIDKNDTLWVVRENKATPVLVDVTKRNEQYICVAKELLNERIVLEPDRYDLYQGCPIKEAKSR